MKTNIISVCFLTMTVFLAGLVSVQADAVNENRVLRKAGGPADGTLKNIVVMTYSEGELILTETTFNRTGSVKVPTSTGKSTSEVEHGGPEEGLDGTAAGKVKKAKVKRGGKMIVYSGNGTAEPVLDEEGLFAGSGSAVSTVRGSKVKSTAKLRGARTLMMGEIEVVTADASSIGKF